MTKVVFCTFADNKYLSSLQRIEKQCKKFKCINEIKIFHQDDIDSEYRALIKPKLYRRGYGYWRWKSYFINKIFEKLQLNDILIWVDAGCDVLQEYEDILKKWISMSYENESGFVAFQQDLVEECYSKEDLLLFLKASQQDRKSGQFLSGCLIIRKTEISYNVINKWYKICRDFPDLVNDKKSNKKNCINFIEHRHDQSVLSLLLKKTDVICLSAAFTLPGSKSPIIANRHKNKTNIINLTQWNMRNAA